MNKNQYKIICSARKTVALEITRNLEILVRVPFRFPAVEIEKFVEEHKQWIEKSMKKQELRNQSRPVLTPDDIKHLKLNTVEIIIKKVEYYSKLMGVTPTEIRITSAEKRFGSCSGKNSLCFSYRLMLYPEVAIDYVIVHELVHIKHKNHSKEFYREIEKYMPEYKNYKELLKK
ncbi:MAG TPA: M48 family peptidase [Clostridiales bacterium]|nr:M48 family peptidase [Clostridiales bacterium]